MSLRRAVISYPAQCWPMLKCGGCIYKSCEFSGSKKLVKESRDFFRLFRNRESMHWTMFNSFAEFATVKASPAIVHVSREKGPGGTGIIIDSGGTVLTPTCNIFARDAEGQVVVNLLDGRDFLGTILHATKDPYLTLLKIQSKIPLPIAKIGSLRESYLHNLVSIEYPFRRGYNPRPSSQNEVVEEFNFIPRLIGQGVVSAFEQKKYNMGCCGGPIVNLAGEIVGISTDMNLYKMIDGNAFYGTMDAMAIEEALVKVGRRRRSIKYGPVFNCQRFLKYEGLN